MRPTLVMRSLAGVAVIAIAALSYWIGVQRLHASRAEAAVPHSGQQAVAQSGLPDGKGAADARAGHRSDRTAAKPATADAQAQPATGTDGPTPRARLAALRPPLSPESENDPFTVLSWLPPPPPPPAAAAPAPEPAPPPSAPALPFVYLGMLNPEAAKPQVFISSGDRLLIVSPGDVIDGVYRFESIAATEARFTYLPLNQRQVMSVQGEGN
ncbi:MULTISPECIES: secretion system X translation initiation factor [Ralstonia solanacearum species complex]|uniref:Secretion system X translation initiation factor n=2 Tax=Ralstonia solanacearum species complex TaxID=3116862 RepID=A0A0S4UVL8_RALSL|nr:MULTISPECIES: secretion system X translation initiation factor [Ralstonia]UZF16028.1 secretion system X translation initiation factor [Ralstonia solanacearum]MCQ4681591.1 secretion system X translation initiation factor [Ralstonia pseudosolanacearum]UZF31108.1 secretion system X translation initiation factor [Ralstonia sp. RS650]CUV26386.1 putative secretion system X translation initiation factor [Ralstonia solanacearum]CUV64046.1 putative secretion system X translation initiation factor [R